MSVESVTIGPTVGPLVSSLFIATLRPNASSDLDGPKRPSTEPFKSHPMMSAIFPCVDVDKQVTALETGASETPNFVTFSTQNGNCVEGDQHFDSLRAKIKSNERVDSLQLQIRHDK